MTVTNAKTTDAEREAAEAGCPHARAAALPLVTLPEDAFESASALSKGNGQGTTGILLVNHGSRSPVWRRMLLDVHAQVADELLAIPQVAQVRTSYMEYTEPSIASQLKAFDADGITDVLVVPLLLTVSDHSLDDIPAICGQPSSPELVAKLASEKIEVYKPDANITFAPLLDFSGLVRTNLSRRVRTILDRGAGDALAPGWCWSAMAAPSSTTSGPHSSNRPVVTPRKTSISTYRPTPGADISSTTTNNPRSMRSTRCSSWPTR